MKHRLLGLIVYPREWAKYYFVSAANKMVAWVFHLGICHYPMATKKDLTGLGPEAGYVINQRFGHVMKLTWRSRFSLLFGGSLLIRHAAVLSSNGAVLWHGTNVSMLPPWMHETSEEMDRKYPTPENFKSPPPIAK